MSNLKVGIAAIKLNDQNVCCACDENMIVWLMSAGLQKHVNQVDKQIERFLPSGTNMQTKLAIKQHKAKLQKGVLLVSMKAHRLGVPSSKEQLLDQSESKLLE